MAEPVHLGVDLNTADVQALIQLPGIGPVLAQRIIQGRPYEHIPDLVRVQGIGENTLERLRPHLALSEPGGLGEPATVPVVAKAPVTALLPASEPEEPEEGSHMKESEGAMNAFQPESKIEPVEVETGEAEEAPAEAAQDKAAEVEAAQAEVEEAGPFEAEVIEAEVVEADVAHEDIADAEVVQVEASEQEVSSWEAEPPPASEEEGKEEEVIEVVPKPQRPAVTRARVRWMALLSIVLATLLGTLLSLAILSYINGGLLQYATPAQVGELSVRAEGLEAQAGVLVQDVEGLRARLDNLEALSGRVDTVEQTGEQLRTDLQAAAGEIDQLAARASELATQTSDLATQAETLAQQADEVEGRVGTLEAQGNRAQAFLEGLAELMQTLFPPEASK